MEEPSSTDHVCVRVCHVCMVITRSKVRIKRIRLPILLVVRTEKMNISLSAFAPENLVSRDNFRQSPSRVNLLISILRLNLVLTYGIPPDFRGGVCL